MSGVVTQGVVGTLATHYIEMECLPNAEVSTGFLIGRLMHAIHLTLVESTPAGQSSAVGVSFPDYRLGKPGVRGRRTAESPPGEEGVALQVGPPIGARVRLFARDAATLGGLRWSRSMTGLGDYIERTAPRPVGDRVTRFAAFARHQPGGSPERLMRRAMRRHGLTEAQARQRYAGYRDQRCDLPYVDMRSESSGSRFRLFIERREVPPSDRWGFSTYGLSPHVPLPLF